MRSSILEVARESCDRFFNRLSSRFFLTTRETLEALSYVGTFFRISYFGEFQVKIFWKRYVTHSSVFVHSNISKRRVFII